MAAQPVAVATAITAVWLWWLLTEGRNSHMAVKIWPWWLWNHSHHSHMAVGGRGGCGGRGAWLWWPWSMAVEHGSEWL